MLSAARTLPIAILLCVLVAPAPRATPAPEALSADTTGARPPIDFPPDDLSIWAVEREPLAAKELEDLIAQDPSSFDLISRLAARKRVDQALDVALKIAAGPPEKIAAAVAESLRVASEDTAPFGRQGTDHAPRLRQLVDAARARIPDLPREDAAHLARQIIGLEVFLAMRQGPSYTDRLQALVSEYPDTTEARLVEVGFILQGGATAAGFDRLREVARANVGNVVGAQALETLGFEMAVNPDQGRNADQADRLLKVLDIVDELEGGRYPPCPAVDAAPSLILEFRPFDARYSPQNLDKVIDGYRRFVIGHFRADETSPGARRVSYLVTSTMPRLFRLKGTEAAGMAQLFAELERRAPEPDAVRYFAASYASDVLHDRGPLVALSSRPESKYARKALATLASQQLSSGEFPAAIRTSARFRSLYPDSPWTWVALVKMGQAQAAIGDMKAAATSFRDAAAAGRSVALARIVGYEYAARVTPDVRLRFADYQHALQAWERGVTPGDVVSCFKLPKQTTETRADSVFDDLSRRALVAGVATLSASLAAPGGEIFEQGQWLMERREWADARATFERMTRQFPSSPLAPTARSLASRARLEGALVLADLDNPRQDDAAALQDLMAVEGGPPDFNSVVATIAHAAILTRNSRGGEGQRLITAALRRWHVSQPILPLPSPGSIEDDVVKIRDVIFEPPRERTMFLVFNPELRIELPDGEQTYVRIDQPLPGADNVLFLDRSQSALLVKARHLAGSAELDVLGAVMRWSPEMSIEFLNAERTRGAGTLSSSEGGSSRFVDKRDGTWIKGESAGGWVN